MTARPHLPSTYSASVRMPGGRMEKRFVTPGKHRVETVNDAGKPVITIRREDKGVVWIIHPADRIYFEQKTATVDQAMAVLFPPLNLEWRDAGPVEIDGVMYRHYHGMGTSRNGPTEEHVYVDSRGMFRRETGKVKGVERTADYFDVSLDDIPSEKFEFDKKGYKKQKL